MSLKPFSRLKFLFSERVFLAALVLMVFASAQAGPAPVWQGTTSDWNTASNWSPSLIPGGGGNAQFGSTGLAGVTLSASVSLGSITYNSGAPTYTINTNSNDIDLGGAGLSNAASQILNVSGGSLGFFNSATADAVSIIDNGAVTFSGAGDGSHFSTADQAKITVNGFLELNDYATAGSASISIAQNGTANFDGHSTAGSAVLVNDWSLFFEGDSSAGNSSLLNGSTGVIRFEQGASAGAASIFNNGEVDFEGAGPATMASAEGSTIVNGGMVKVEQDATLGNALVSNLDNVDDTLMIQSGGSAGSANIYNGLVDTVLFKDNSTAENSKINNQGTLDFQDTSTAASATILNSGTMNFLGDSATLLATAGSASVSNSGQIIFAADSTAGNSTITNLNAASSTIYFSAGAGAGSATLVNGTGDGIQFFNNSTAGSASVSNAGEIDFQGGAPTTNGGIVGATAGDADFVNSGVMNFNNFSTAGSSSVTNRGLLAFRDNSSAGAASILNENNASATIYFTDAASAGGAQLVNGLNDLVTFGGTSTAGSAAMVNNGRMVFGGDDEADQASAGNASITNNGVLGFSNFSTAQAATIDTTSGASIIFGDQSDGGTARLIVENGGVFDSSFASGGVTVGSIEGDGDFDLGANNLTTGTDNLSTTVSGLIADGGLDGGTGGVLTKTGTGNLTLTSANSYSGGTEITGGILTAQNSGALGTGDVLVQNGTLATSGGPLDLTLGSGYTQSTDGKLALTLYGSGLGQHDLLNVNDSAQLGGALVINSSGGYTPVLGQTFEVLDAEPIVGIFEQVDSGVAGVRFVPFYTNRTVTIDTILGSFADLGSIHMTPNEAAVAGALDAAFDDPNELSLMQTLGTSTNSTLQKDYDLMDPSALAGVFQMDFATARAEAVLVGQRLDLLTGGAGLGWTAAALKYGTEQPLFAGNLPAQDEARISRKVLNEEQDWQVFATGAGNFGTLTGDSNAAGYQFSTGGLTAGMDRSLGRDLIGGILLAYHQSGATQTNSTLKATGGTLGLYAGWKQKELRVEGLLQGGFDNYQTQRVGFGGTASGTTSGLEFGGQIGAGYDWTMGEAAFGPFVSGQYSYVQMNGFTETGSSVPLTVPSQGQGSFLSDLGAKAVLSFKMGGNFILTPSFSAAWEHIYSGNAQSLNANLDPAFSPSTAFTVDGPSSGSDGFVVGGGLNAQFAPGVGAYAGAQARLGFTDYSSSSFEGGLNFGL